MNPLVDALLGILKEHPLVQSSRVLNYDETASGKLELKVRCRLVKNFGFQIWLHLEPTFEDYAYQLFTNIPIMRWDNAPHYPNLPQAPHHFHDESDNVKESNLTGDVLSDLRSVLEEIAVWLAEK